MTRESSDYDEAVEWRKAAMNNGWEEIGWRQEEERGHVIFILRKGKTRAAVVMARGIHGSVTVWTPGRRRREPMIPYDEAEFWDA